MMMKKPYMKIQVSACPIVDKIIVKNICSVVDHDDIVLYFEDSRHCPDGGDVASVKMYDGNKKAVVQFIDSSGMC